MQKIKFFNSGLYTKSFYQTYDTEEILCDDWDFRQHCHYNKELMKTRYSEVELSNLDEDQIDELVDDDFFKDINDHFILYEPLIFNEAIALDCGLIPFIYHGDNKYELLALGDSGFDPSIKTNLLFKLDAYQVLTDNSIDEHSPFFGTYSKDIVKRVLGDEVYNRVVVAINNEVIW
jgi:hypothetical protein